jgi:prepilin-type processing-associated H-X9-DG protein
LFGFGNVSYADGHMPDLVETAVKAGKFQTLAAALGAAGLVETLKSKGPFTVFAPTDEAFAKIDAATLADLLKPENKDKLTAILTYHVVSGKVMSSDIKGDMEAPTVNGKSLSIKLMGGKVMINEATVIAPDVNADNGVIHIIDTVLLP